MRSVPVSLAAAVLAALCLTAYAEQARLEIVDPDEPQSTTTRAFANILGRADKDASVTVNGEPALVVSTGMFVRDAVPLQVGENRIDIQMTRPGAPPVRKTIAITRVVPPEEAPKPATGRPEIRTGSIVPAQDVQLAVGDVFTAGFRGTPDCSAEFILPSGKRCPMIESTDPGTSLPTGNYSGAVVVTDAAKPGPVRFRLSRQARIGKRTRMQFATAQAEGRLDVRPAGWLQVARVNGDFAQLMSGLHEVRLGGPYITELCSGTLVRITGRMGEYYRVRLTPSFDAWVWHKDVDLLPAGTPPPHAYFTSLSVTGDDYCDMVTIPFPRRIPFSIAPVQGPGGNAALDIDFYGAHDAATWISHRPSAKVVREATTQQIGTDHLRVRLDLVSKQLWGYRWEATTESLRVYVRRAPKLAAKPDSPLKGLTVAIEAGHGGPRDRGARGISGSNEKDINLLAAKELAEKLREAGATAVLVRDEDVAMTLGEKTRKAMACDAHLFISTHCNAAGTERGYLRVSGTSTYYKYPFCRDFSEKIHARLLEDLQIGDFGNVGNFNYGPLRKLTWMPSMLVEKAFMSNPQDEAMLLDPAFRTRLVRAVVKGTEDFLDGARQ